MNKIIILIIIVAAMITSCEREVKNIILPEFRQKLVIHSYISPSDTLSFVRVSSNRRIYGELNTGENTGNLSATISNGTTTVNLTRVTDGFLFRPGNMKIEEGKSYTLKVISDKGLSAEASCTVPLKRDFMIEADTSRSFYAEPYNGGYYRIQAIIHLTDFPGESNYFRFSCKELLYDPGYYYYPEKFQLLGQKQEFFDDSGKDGRKFLVDIITASEPYKSDSAFLVFYIQNTDKAYYTFHKSLENYSGGSDPFSEVSPLYSNINGGLGVFSAYTVDSLVVRLK